MDKTCTKCLQAKPASGFHKHKPSKDGLKPRCKVCQCLAENARRTEPDHKAVQAWHDLNKRVREQSEYSHVEIRVTREEFIAWLTPKLTAWLASTPEIRPSVDREDPTGHYELDNLRLISLSENSRRTRNHHNVHAPSGQAWCGKCQKYKPRVEFAKNAHKPHGLQNHCRVCRKS